MIYYRDRLIYQAIFAMLCRGWAGACIGALLWMFVHPVTAQATMGLRAQHVADIRRNFNQPTEVAVDQKGRVYVLDGANHQIKVFSAKWKYIRTIGRRGAKKVQFLNPVGFDIDDRGRLLVADTGNQRIQVLDTAGKYIRQIDLKPWNARAVEVQTGPGYNRIYVSDARNHQILVFDADGKFISAWGAMGDGRGQLRFPGMMALDPGKNICVVDILNGRIQIFDRLGNNSNQVGELGVLPGQLYRPKGILVLDDARMLVSDSYTGVIQVFDATGRLEAVLTAVKDDNHLRLTTPLGMAVDAHSRLYVVESTLNKVSVFNLK